MKKLIWASVLTSLVLTLSCGKKSSNNNSSGTPAVACTQNVTYDQYGRPIQSCINGVNGQNNPYGYPGGTYPYGNNNGYYPNVGMNGNPCAMLSAQWQVNYTPRFMNGQWWCVQPGYMQGMYY